MKNIYHFFFARDDDKAFITTQVMMKYKTQQQDN